MATVTFIAQRKAILLQEIATVTGIDVDELQYIKDPVYRELEMLEMFLDWATTRAVGTEPPPPPEPEPKPKPKRGRPKKQTAKE